MKRLLLLILPGRAPAVNAQTQERRDETAEESFGAFLAGWGRAQSRPAEGDAAQWKRMSSQGDDATGMGAFGGSGKGWNEVGSRYDYHKTAL